MSAKAVVLKTIFAMLGLLALVAVVLYWDGYRVGKVTSINAGINPGWIDGGIGRSLTTSGAMDGKSVVPPRQVQDDGPTVFGGDANFLVIPETNGIQHVH